MTANIPIPPMAKVNSDNTATCDGVDRYCLPGFMKNVHAGSSNDGGEIEVNSRTSAQIGASKSGSTPSGQKPSTMGYQKALELAAAELKASWDRAEALVKSAFEEEFKEQIRERKGSFTYRFGLTASKDLKDVTVHMIWEPRRSLTRPGVPTPLDDGHHH